MRRSLLSLVTILLVGAAVALSGGNSPLSIFQFEKEARNPVSHFRWNLEPQDFQFAIVSDRTGSHRANIYSQAVHKLNLLQPEFVVSVGDLVEGGKNVAALDRQWKEFDGFNGQLTMPFFYAAGNHDVGTKESAKFWEEKLGRRYYHFVYRGVLFLFLNSDDPPGSVGNIAKEQADFVRQVLGENRAPRWTMVFVHRPLWAMANIEQNGWLDVEKALDGRPYTVICGHVHRFQKFVRNGQNYYQLATTGGGSLVRGPEYGEFDHITWVTVKKDGPVISHVLLDAIHAEDLKAPITDEPVDISKRKPTYAATGQVHFEGVPLDGAEIRLLYAKGGKSTVAASGKSGADGRFTLSTYTANDGAPAGEYAVAVTWRPQSVKGKAPNQLPARYGTTNSGLKANIQAGKNELTLELTK